MDHIQITDSDYESGITDLGLLIRIKDYGIRIGKTSEGLVGHPNPLFNDYILLRDLL